MRTLALADIHHQMAGLRVIRSTLVQIDYFRKIQNPLDLLYKAPNEVLPIGSQNDHFRDHLRRWYLKPLQAICCTRFCQAGLLVDVLHTSTGRGGTDENAACNRLHPMEGNKFWRLSNSANALTSFMSNVRFKPEATVIRDDGRDGLPVDLVGGLNG